jgi:hypothetical protein
MWRFDCGMKVLWSSSSSDPGMAVFLRAYRDMTCFMVVTSDFIS